MSGFGNREFEMMTSSENNSYVKDGILYIVPTLTSDVIGKDAIFNDHTYNLTGCTNGNLTHCSAVSNATMKSVINPVQSARLTTKYSHAIQYGRVEIRARLPRGDWIWPAIWMLPVDNEYGPWPVSGEIDLMESRGNDLDYPFQGRNYVRTSLNWGPVDFINAVDKTHGWFTGRRTDFSDDFHTFVLEWSDTFLRSYVDTPLHPMFNIRFDKPFFDRVDFPKTALNNTEEIVIRDPWAHRGNSAPFDRPFYLILNVAVGGRNGWFPDTLGGKMWFDSSNDAMHDFAKAQEAWYSTWPQDPTRRGMAIDYVKMWQKC
ncbi:concanavalin A-like lectin/glucanase [Fomitiporia mediterranea MF3/22]|uniref:concanavalin A-like lectin/glucanase n=1 Tax=Fomitiporia mediterranea (strain MF3/22) TaxID=694068 RepID=UPI000440969B|nr:concanavalin A-like lectin/glucanase [Fomitiporia mediterranea MF3/22]EJD03316.1 concanavalin A-like lectin/glucanase [Fomitiporia mediterranea MF3/22]